jgi:hypothetical protein
MAMGHKVIHTLNQSFFIVSQAVLPAIAMSVKHNCDKSRTVRLGGASVLASRRLKKTRLVSSLAPPDELFTCRKAILRYNAGRLWRKTSRPTKTA